MKIRQAILSFIFGMIALTLLASCQSPAPPTTPAAPTTPPTTPTAPAPSSASVEMSGLAFKPATVTIAAGGTVTWTNKDFTAHTVTSDDGSFDSGQLGPNGTFSHTYNAAGTYGYRCTLHATMKGTVVVQ